jgi:hypothetical protein
VELPSSDRPSLRTILVMLVLALAVLLAAVSSGFRHPATARPWAPASATIQAPSALNDAVGLERAENGPKQCVGPHEIEGPLC